MKILWTQLCVAMLATAPAFAEGDAEAGEKVFKKCKACHMIADGDNVLLKGGKTGPNLYGFIGRTAGTYEGFKYGKSLVAAGEAGLVWDEEQFLTYVQDPTKFLKTYLDDSKARSKMALKLKKGGDDVLAYINSFASDSGS